MEHRGPHQVHRPRPAGHARHRHRPGRRPAPRRPGRHRPAGTRRTPARSTPLEGRAFLGDLLAETRCADPLLGDAAAAWIGGALADPPFVRSPAEIAALLGVRHRDATAAIATVRGIAGRILTDRYGITAPAPWDASGLSA